MPTRIKNCPLQLMRCPVPDRIPGIGSWKEGIMATGKGKFKEFRFQLENRQTET
ncbi:hypothetical protein KKI24_09770 [bacterium]|nr:hypothetical protein [bacterium]